MGKLAQYSWILLIVLVGIIITGCSALPPSTAQSEEELIGYMLDYLLRIEIQSNYAYIPPTETPGYMNRAHISLVVLAPLKDNLNDLHQPLDIDQAIQAWWIVDNRLMNASDAALAIDLYRENYMTSAGIDAWAFYKLGIFSISERGKEAEVYLEISCGPKCGHGELFMFQRNQYGQWNKTGSEWKWIE